MTNLSYSIYGAIAEARRNGLDLINFIKEVKAVWVEILNEEIDSIEKMK